MNSKSKKLEGSVHSKLHRLATYTTRMSLGTLSHQGIFGNFQNMLGHVIIGGMHIRTGHTKGITKGIPSCIKALFGNLFQLDLVFTKIRHDHGCRRWCPTSEGGVFKIPNNVITILALSAFATKIIVFGMQTFHQDGMPTRKNRTHCCIGGIPKR